MNTGAVARPCLRLARLAIMVLAIAGAARAASIRGRVERQGPSGPYPAAYISVTLSVPGRGRSYPVYTGRDGMYYFNNIPAGDYLLEVWIGGPRALTYRIRVSEPTTDLPPVVVP